MAYAPVAAIEACLQAVKAGLLEMRWDLLCPRCRVSKSWVGTLDRLPKGAHCPSCNIDYDADFSKNVEAGFRPSPALRKLESGEYCLFGPMSTPHIKLQIQLEPGESRSVPAVLTPGPYRLRTLEPGPECAVEYPGGGFPQLIVTSDAVTAGPPPPGGDRPGQPQRPAAGRHHRGSQLAGRLPHRRPADGAPGLPRSLQRRCAAAGG
jgi:hypothetical protein